MCVKKIKLILVGPDSMSTLNLVPEEFHLRKNRNKAYFMSTFNLVSGNDRPKKSVLLASPSETQVKREMNGQQIAHQEKGD